MLLLWFLVAVAQPVDDEADENEASAAWEDEFEPIGGFKPEVVFCVLDQPRDAFCLNRNGGLIRGQSLLDLAGVAAV